MSVTGAQRRVEQAQRALEAAQKELELATLAGSDAAKAMAGVRMLRIVADKLERDYGTGESPWHGPLLDDFLLALWGAVNSGVPAPPIVATTINELGAALELRLDRTMPPGSRARDVAAKIKRGLRR